MHAEAGRGIHAQDVGHRQAACLLAGEDAQLVVVAAIAGNRVQWHAIAQGSHLHRLPGARGVVPQDVLAKLPPVPEGKTVFPTLAEQEAAKAAIAAHWATEMGVQ